MGKVRVKKPTNIDLETILPLGKLGIFILIKGDLKGVRKSSHNGTDGPVMWKYRRQSTKGGIMTCGTDKADY